MALGLGAWMLLSAPEPTPDDDGGTAAVRAGGTDPDSPLDPGTGSQEMPTGPRAVGGFEMGVEHEYTLYGRVFDGTGTITGEVTIDPGTVYPKAWTVTLEPSRVADGSERAITRVIHGEPGQRTFELRDLPMAAYRIHAEAPGMASMAQEVALFKIEGHEHLAGMDNVHATVKLRKVAYVDGAVRTSNGDVADELPIFLVDRMNKDALALATRTDIAGLFRFDTVNSGAWMLHVGDAVRPLVPPIPVSVSGTPMRLDDVTLPPLALLKVLVFDEYGRPFPDVDLVGYLRGSGSGSFRVRSDALGTATVRYLAPGPWRVEALHAVEGQKGKADLALSASDDESTLHEIHIR